VTPYRDCDQDLKSDIREFLVSAAGGTKSAAALSKAVADEFGVVASQQCVYDLLRRNYGIHVRRTAELDVVSSYEALDDLEDSVPPVKRRCMNKFCIERFTPVNDNHWYHHADCRRSEDLWTKEEILREEGSMWPNASGPEMVARAFGQKNTLQRRVQQLTSLRDFLKYELASISKANPSVRIPRVREPDGAGGRGGKPREVVLFCSDWQIGKLENGIGVREFVEHRFPRIIEAVTAIVEHLRASGHPVERIWVVYDGDMIEGCFIYGGQNVTGLDRSGNTHRLIRQIQLAAHLEATLALKMAEVAPEVVVVSVPGNHGRPNGKNDFSDPEDNFDTLVAEWAKDKAALQPNVRWEIEDEWWARFDVLGHRNVAIHGDQWNGPVAKLEQLLPSWVLSDIFGCRPDVFLTAHRHSFLMMDVSGVVVIQNGTADGGSLWYTKAYGRSSRPVQTVYVVSEKHKVESVYPIYLQG